MLGYLDKRRVMDLAEEAGVYAGLRESLAPVGRDLVLARQNGVGSFSTAMAEIDSLAFNWLVGGTDAHAKDFSLLIGAGGRARLAPLYDIASVLSYQGAALHKVKLAMKIGEKYRLREIGSHEWRKLAGTLRLDPDETVQRVRRIAVQKK